VQGNEVDGTLAGAFGDVARGTAGTFADVSGAGANVMAGGVRRSLRHGLRLRWGRRGGLLAGCGEGEDDQREWKRRKGCSAKTVMHGPKTSCGWMRGWRGGDPGELDRYARGG